MDLREKKTKKLIEEQFVKMLGEMEFSHITVRDLCERAWINRSTFYRHYQDIYQLRDMYIDRLLDTFVDSLEGEFLSADHLHDPDYSEKLKESLRHFRQDKDDYLVLWSQKTLGRNVFEEMIERGAEKMEQGIIGNPHIAKGKKGLASWYAKLLVNNMMVSVRWWFEHEQQISVETMTGMILRHMMKGTIPTLME